MLFTSPSMQLGVGNLVACLGLNWSLWARIVQRDQSLLEIWVYRGSLKSNLDQFQFQRLF